MPIMPTWVSATPKLHPSGSGSIGGLRGTFNKHFRERMQ
jgi:hypothetical protein